MSLLFDFPAGSYNPPLGNAIEFSFNESADLFFNQQITLPLLVNQSLTQKLLQRETLSQFVKPALSVNQSIIKWFSLIASAQLEIKLLQELYKSIAGYGPAVTLFNEPLPIEQISLTFDQLGRPLVFYRVGEDTLKLYWYDPIAQQNVLTNFGIGKDPAACFDFPQDTGRSFTDVLLFYVRDNQVFMRIQRDRYEIEYPCPATQQGLKINSAGLRVDNRLQVVYQFSDEGYVAPVIEVPDTVIVDPEDIEPEEPGEPTEPEEPEPNQPVVIVGRHYYRQPGLAAIHTAAPMIANRYVWSAGFDMRGYDASRTGVITLLSQGANVAPLSFSPTKRLPTALLVAYFKFQSSVRGTFFVRINRRDHFFVSSELLRDGRYEITVNGNAISIKRNGNSIAGGPILPAPNFDDNGPLTFASSLYRFGNELRPEYPAIEAQIYNAWVDTSGVKTSWRLSNNGEAQQPSSPAGTPLTLINHRAENWRFEQS